MYFIIWEQIPWLGAAFVDGNFGLHSVDCNLGAHLLCWAPLSNHSTMWEPILALVRITLRGVSQVERKEDSTR